MPAKPTQPQSPSLSVSDIYYLLFRHKWKIIILSVTGLLAAAAHYKLRPPPYVSQAKLFVRYVISESRNLGPGALAAMAKSPDRGGETIMNSEMEILMSFDLARQVAQAVGPAKILKKVGGGDDVNAAATVIAQGLSANVTPRSSIIQLIFTHPDVEIVQPVLREIIDQYYKMHGTVHRSKGAVADYLVQETDTLRARLQTTEDDLRKARNRANIFSIEDARKTLSEQIANLRQHLFTAQADLAARLSVVQELARQNPEPEARPAAPEGTLSAQKVEEHKVAIARLLNVQRMEQELLTQFTPESPRVKEVRAQVAEAEAAKIKLEREYPALVQAATRPAQAQVGPHASSPLIIDAATAATEIVALQAKIKTLTGQLEMLREEAAKIDQIESEMSQLKRKKDLDEANYKLFSKSIEESKIAEALGGGGISNILAIQTPTPGAPNLKKKTMIAMALAVGGIALGLGWAVLIEFWLDRSVRRPVDVERMQKLPLFLSIPELKSKQPARLKGAPPAGGAELVLPADFSPLRAFHDTLRDRLIMYFESKGLTHKPKLVAVSALAAGAGTTTTAAGLARSLSETGDGNVLLVDMTSTQGSAQHFVKGAPLCGLDELLDARDSANVEPNLYVVTENTNSDRLSRNLPQRFNKLIPKLKASDFDYIIFDMPPVTQISITPRLASFMDMVLLVVESEKTDRDVLQRAGDLLAQSKAHVGVVMNKAKAYIPRQLRSGEHLALS